MKPIDLLHSQRGGSSRLDDRGGGKVFDMDSEAAAPPVKRYRGRTVPDTEWEARWKFITPRWQGGQTLTMMASTLGVNPASIRMWIARGLEEGYPPLVEANRIRINRENRKKIKTKAKTLEERFIDEFGVSSHEASRRNMSEFYAGEIKGHMMGKEIDESVRSTLYRYGLIPFPPRHTRRGPGRQGGNKSD